MPRRKFLGFDPGVKGSLRRTECKGCFASLGYLVDKAVRKAGVEFGGPDQFIGPISGLL